MATPDPDNLEADEVELDQALEQVERSLFDLKVRYAQVQRDTERKSELERRQKELQRQPKRIRNLPEIKAELRQIEQQLEHIELNLESRLFSWSGLKDPFWQAVRFGGLGIILGWILKSCAG
ncbi:MAG: hypothetical protein ACOC0N_11715 [Chroococcales cyanobacterium]